MFVKFANAKVLDVYDHRSRTAAKKLSSFDYEPRSDGKYLYAAVRACTADVPNLNYDMLPGRELKTAYKSFIGAYNYLNHDNTDPAKARGAVIDAKYHDEDPDDKWIECLIEMDEERCPKLCSLVRSGEIDTVSMGCNVESTTCSVCGNVAEYPFQYCEHVQQKGRKFGGKLAYEICNGIDFFELSWVYDPADPTAHTERVAGKTAAPSRGIKEPLDTLYKSLQNGVGKIPSKPKPSQNEGNGGNRRKDKGVKEKSDAAEKQKPKDENLCGFTDTTTGEPCRNPVAEGEQFCHLHGGGKEGSRIDWKRKFSAVYNARRSRFSSTTYGSGNFATAPRVPDDVDIDSSTADACPLCGDPNFDGEFCEICGYEEPPEGFGDIELEEPDDYDEYESDASSDDSADYGFDYESVSDEEEDAAKADALAESGQAADEEFGDEEAVEETVEEEVVEEPDDDDEKDDDDEEDVDDDELLFA